MYSDSILNPPQWKNYGHIRDTILDGKRTLREAYNFLQDNYTGIDKRTSTVHQMFCAPSDSKLECNFRFNLRESIKKGYGKDIRFPTEFDLSIWNDYYHLHYYVLNGKRTIKEAYTWIEANYTGNKTKKAKIHQFNNNTSDNELEDRFKQWLSDAIKLGHGSDKDFESVFR